jgi:tripartite ATP-independent transporter DctM subunit
VTALGIFIASLLVLLAIGMPIAFALLISGIPLMLLLNVFDSQIIGQRLIDGADQFHLMAIPFFILAGELMNKGGITNRIIDFALSLLGHVRGGLGYVAIVSSIVFAGISGSAMADIAALSAILIPMMVRAGYNKNQSAGLIASAGILAPIIPPSTTMILFGVVGGVSVTHLFMGGIIPGLIIGVFLMITWTIVIRRQKTEVLPKKSWREALRTFIKSFWALLMPLIIIGGLRGGIFTPTEGGVVAVAYALLVGMFIYRELNFKSLIEGLVESAKTTSVVMFMAASALVSSWLITVARLPQAVTDLLQPLIPYPSFLLLSIVLLILVLGMVLDVIPMILIFTPILIPIVQKAGIDPVYFGVLFIMVTSIGLITPPVGAGLVVSGTVSRINMLSLTRGILVFLLAEIIAIILMVFFPQLITVPLEWLT